jgi:ankyrin repeat protein
MVKMLIDASTDVNLYPLGDDPSLVLAAKSLNYGRWRVIALLLQAGADPNLHELGSTALFVVTNPRKLINIETAQMLINAGALLDIQHEVTGKTPLHRACRRWEEYEQYTTQADLDIATEIVKILIEAGANVNLLVESPRSPPQDPRRTGSPLHAALSQRTP